MSPTDWVLLPWDTRHFGFPTARFETGVTSMGLEATVREMREAGITLAYAFLPDAEASNTEVVRRLGGVLVDRKTTYVALASKILEAGEPSQDMLTIGPPSTPVLRELALQAGAFSRFKVDPRFPRHLFELLYTHWLDRSLAHEIASEVFATVDSAGPTGLMTVGAKAGRCDIGLIVVAERARGRGLGSALLRRGAKWALDAGHVEVQVVTQGDNIPACRLYERSGFAVETVENVFHFWLEGADR